VRRALPGLALVALLTPAASDGGPTPRPLESASVSAAGASVSFGPTRTPVLREYRYRLSGAIRPLLFWIGDGDVGSARIVRQDDEGSRRGCELLIGSDPDRAPRGINRWGWVWEEQRADGGTQRGLMRKIDEDSLEEVERIEERIRLENAYVFKSIRTEIEGGEARAENTVWVLPEDYTYYDVRDLLDVVDGEPQAPPQVNEARMPPVVRPGILLATADLVDRAVAAATQEPRRLLENVAIPFNFNAIVCDLTLRETKWEESKEYGGRRYERLVRLELESYDPEHDDRQKYTLVCGTDGPWRGIPVYMKFQPKWWFRTEGVLDESQGFDPPRDHALRSGDF
jgi:hypothetical protein